MRIDKYLVTRGLVSGREGAKRLIEAGAVSVNGQTVYKPSFEVSAGDAVGVREDENRSYVSRGALKLEAAMQAFELDVAGLVALDIGASTGGFTDCLLRHGAARVYALDAGVGQLHPTFAAHPRVVGIDKYNARNLCFADFGFCFDMAVMDVSFISQTLIIPALPAVLKAGAPFVSLIKPQFEAGRQNIGKGGIVKSAAARREAVTRVLDCAAAHGFGCRGIIPSPITGGDGNLEYLACFYSSMPGLGRPDDRTVADMTADKPSNK